MKKLRFLLIYASFALLSCGSASNAAAHDFNDSHFHLTNYVQEGPSLPEFLRIMGERAGRVAVFGIPLQQKWDYFESGPRAPDYYLLTDAELYYYSFTDAIVADQYLHLSAKDRARFDPMITGFNPTDMYAVDHIRRVLLMYPGVFSGIGEFSVHKEFVSAKVAGHTASLLNPALDRILTFAGETGLVVILHNDINTVRPAPGRPANFDDLKSVFRSHRDASIIWAHTGLGRFVKPTSDHLNLLREMLSGEEYSHVNFDLSWDEVAKWVVADAATLDAWVTLLQQYPDRFLFGSDMVAPKSQADYLKAYEAYQKLWERLDGQTARKVKAQNYERLFDAARLKVRQWEDKQVKLKK
ncbi:MAG TPA: amidohydrolase family protein [Burkholderiales bacterium]|nr:amidohydrolase family protein [Burkholderiales bacterium]